MTTLFKFLAVPPADQGDQPIDFYTDDAERIAHVTRLWTEAGWDVTVKVAEVDWSVL